MNATLPHISVCICTYKRPKYLKRLLTELDDQQTDGLFTYSIVVSDNDRLRSAELVAKQFAATSHIPIKYCLQPQQNIARARNTAVTNAEGQYVAFIDDDEFPIKKWLLTLYKTIRELNVDGVLGPVNPYFDVEPPKWILQGKFHDRPSHPTGLRLDWNMCRTGNVLLDRKILAQESEPFRPECLSGEDQDFFRRMSDIGRVFVWCHEAEVLEVVPPARCTRTFLIKRALMRGVFSLRNHGFPLSRIVKSIVAIPVYVAVLPIGLLMGQARFMKIMFKLSYHFGRVLALVGVNPISQPYLVD